MQLIHRVQIKYSFSVRIQPRWDVLLQRSKVMHRRLWVTAGATAANPRNSVRLRAVISSRLAETDNLKSSLNRKPEAVNMVDAGGKVSRYNEICSCGFVALTIPPHRFFSGPFDHLTRDYVMARD